jgi:hypothetical protein
MHVPKVPELFNTTSQYYHLAANQCGGEAVLTLASRPPAQPPPPRFEDWTKLKEGPSIKEPVDCRTG